jgi:hypothetical protein
MIVRMADLLTGDKYDYSMCLVLVDEISHKG